MNLPPLAGYTVAVTADRRREEQVELLRRRGAEVLEGPTVRTVPLGDDESLLAGIDAIIARPPDFTVLLTALGTRGLVAAAESHGRDEDLLDAIDASTVMVRGPKAAGAALAVGVEVDWRTTGEESTELVAELTEAARAGARIAVQRDGAVRGVTADALQALGADVIDIPVYRWSLPEDLAPAERLLDAVCAGTVDAVTFTSSPAIRNLVDLATARARDAALREALAGPVLAVCVGPVCQATARAVGIPRLYVPRRARLGAMVQALVKGVAGRPHHFDVGELTVTVQGALVLIGDEEVRLPDRERAVLHSLIDAGGAVVPKRTLLRAVWGEGTDEHTVEATVGRLRRRLGPVGEAISTVQRRGYRFDARRREVAAAS